MQQRRDEILSAEKLQLFAAGLSGLSPEEVRKAKVLYLRNAISEYEAFRAQAGNFGCVLIFFAIFPLFWPFLYVMRRSMKIQQRLFRQRIANAVAVWREDLAGEVFEIDGERID